MYELLPFLLVICLFGVRKEVRLDQAGGLVIFKLVVYCQKLQSCFLDVTPSEEAHQFVKGKEFGNKRQLPPHDTSPVLFNAAGEVVVVICYTLPKLALFCLFKRMASWEILCQLFASCSSLWGSQFAPCFDGILVFCGVVSRGYCRRLWICVDMLF
jgi:hypothetical protein